MIKIVLPLFALTAAVMSVNTANAVDDIYFGTGFGAAHFNGLKKTEGINVGEENAASTNLFMGYNFNEDLGAELGYHYAGRGNTDGNRYENQGATFSVVHRLPLGGDIALFAEGGAYWAHTDGMTLTTTDTKISPLIGAGVSYKVNNELDLQARYRYMWNVADLHADNGERYKPNQSIATLEVVYHPFRSVPVVPVVPVSVPDIGDTQASNFVEKNISLDSDILFSFGKGTLTQEGVAILSVLHKKIVSLQPKDGNVVVVGYTDRIGSDAYNKKLSEERARSVANFLVKKGLTASNVGIEGRGKAESVTGSQCDGIIDKAQRITCLAPDRRVEILITAVKDTDE